MARTPVFKDNIARLFDEAASTELTPGIVSLIESKATRAQIREIPVGKILPNPAQPRLSYEEDSLTELAESIREHGVLQGHEHADTAGRGVDRSGERDDQQKRVIVDHGKGHARRDHQAGASQQKAAVIMLPPEETDTDRQQRGTEERRGRDDADLQGRKSEREQIDRQQHGHETIAHVAQGTRCEEECYRMNPQYQSGSLNLWSLASASWPSPVAA